MRYDPQTIWSSTLAWMLRSLRDHRFSRLIRGSLDEGYIVELLPEKPGDNIIGLCGTPRATMCRPSCPVRQTPSSRPSACRKMRATRQPLMPRRVRGCTSTRCSSGGNRDRQPRMCGVMSDLTLIPESAVGAGTGANAGFNRAIWAA